ncbi:MAG: hypothetical protein C0501_04105 [Isosphaera sp.]|nr:hypothetical protein [Isosphaera sp.]
MERIALDADGRVNLDRVTAELAVTDATGKTLGFFVPPRHYYRMMLAVLGRQSATDGFDGSRQSHPDGWTTAQVLEYLAEVEREWKERRG